MCYKTGHGEAFCCSSASSVPVVSVGCAGDLRPHGILLGVQESDETFKAIYQLLRVRVLSSRHGVLLFSLMFCSGAW